MPRRADSRWRWRARTRQGSSDQVDSAMNASSKVRSICGAIGRDWRANLLGTSAVVLGVAFPAIAVIRATGHIYAPLLFQGLLPGAAFVVVGIWAFRRPSELARVLGAAVGALSAPLYLPLIALAHPDNAGADIGRGLVGLLMLAMLPLNMWIGALVGQRVRAGGAPAVPHATQGRTIGLTVGLGAVATAVLILWQASAKASPDPEVAYWEVVHHGLLPAVPIAMVGAAMMAFPSRFPMVGGALLGTLPALACSSLVVDPDPANHGQVPEVLLAYSLPVTLPATVGLGALLGDRIGKRILASRSRSTGP